MQSIKLQSQTDQDGVLKLEFPLGLSNTEFEVLVIIQPTTPAKKREWPPGFFDRTAGSLADDPIERPPQGEYEIRDEIP